MDNARLKQLASYNLVEGYMPVNKFKDMLAAQREKQLWQWSTSKQMDFQDWKVYLQAHVEAEEHDHAMNTMEEVKQETKE